MTKAKPIICCAQEKCLAVLVVAHLLFKVVDASRWGK